MRTALLSAAIGLSSFSCAGEDRRLEQHEKALQSLASTTRAISDAWAGGNTSGRYARTALEQTLRLVDQERAKIAGRPVTLVDPRGARLSRQADELERAIAQIIKAVGESNGDDARRIASSLQIEPGRDPQ